MEKIKSHYKDLNIISSGFVSKRSYYKELKDAKVSISPFGWGEICYKDFEIILAGALLIKPSMNHLETFPNVYLSERTYLPVKWDLSDLSMTIERALTEPDLCKNISTNAAEVYLSLYNDSERFCTHFLDILKVNEIL